MRSATAFILALTLTAGGTVAAQSSWQDRADLQSSAAAASIVSFFVCEGASTARAVGERVHGQLERLGLALAQSTGANSREVLHYLADSANMKVRALWQAQQGKSCFQTKNLQSVARALGFDTPDSN